MMVLFFLMLVCYFIFFLWQQCIFLSANDIIIQSKQALVIPLQIQRTKGQTEGEAECVLFILFFSIEPTGHHLPLTTISGVLLSGKLKKFSTQLLSLFGCSFL